VSLPAWVANTSSHQSEALQGGDLTGGSGGDTGVRQSPIFLFLLEAHGRHALNSPTLEAAAGSSHNNVTQL